MSRDVYLRAADLIETGMEYCACFAIDRAVNTSFSPSRMRFEELFGPRTALEGRGFDGLLWLRRYREPNEASKHRRVVALCFMAAMEDK